MSKRLDTRIRGLILRRLFPWRRLAWLLNLAVVVFVGVANVSATPPEKQRSVGNVLAWGSNYQGVLGNGTTTDSYTPVPASNLSGVVAIAADTDHSLALKSNGTVWAWGVGQLGDGGYYNNLAPATTSLQVTSVIGNPIRVL